MANCCFIRSRNCSAYFVIWFRCNGSSDLSFSRNRRVRIGEVSLEEIVIMSGERLIIDGIIKLAVFGVSITL